MQLCISCVRKILGNGRGNTDQNWNKSLALLCWPAGIKRQLKSVPAQLSIFQEWLYSEILGEVAFFHGRSGWRRGQGWDGHECLWMLKTHFYPKLHLVPGLSPCHPHQCSCTWFLSFLKGKVNYFLAFFHSGLVLCQKFTYLRIGNRRYEGILLSWIHMD